MTEGNARHFERDTEQSLAVIEPHHQEETNFKVGFHRCFAQMKPRRSVLVFVLCSENREAKSKARQRSSQVHKNAMLEDVQDLERESRATKSLPVSCFAFRLYGVLGGWRKRTSEDETYLEMIVRVLRNEGLKRPQSKEQRKRKTEMQK